MIFKTGMKRLMKEKNPIRTERSRPVTKEFKYRCNLYLGGKNGDRVYLGKPVIHDENNLTLCILMKLDLET